jgi:hypothetical protein
MFEMMRSICRNLGWKFLLDLKGGKKQISTQDLRNERILLRVLEVSSSRKTPENSKGKNSQVRGKALLYFNSPRPSPSKAHAPSLSLNLAYPHASIPPRRSMKSYSDQSILHVTSRIPYSLPNSQQCQAGSSCRSSTSKRPVSDHLISQLSSPKQRPAASFSPVTRVIPVEFLTSTNSSSTLDPRVPTLGQLFLFKSRKYRLLNHHCATSQNTSFGMVS